MKNTTKFEELHKYSCLKAFRVMWQLFLFQFTVCGSSMCPLNVSKKSDLSQKWKNKNLG